MYNMPTPVGTSGRAMWSAHVVGPCVVAAARDHRRVPRFEAPQKALGVTFVAGRSDAATALRLGTSNTPLLMMGPPRIKDDGMKHPEGMGGEKRGCRAGLPPGSMAVTPSLSSCCKSSSSKSETALVIETAARPATGTHSFSRIQKGAETSSGVKKQKLGTTVGSAHLWSSSASCSARG